MQARQSADRRPDTLGRSPRNRLTARRWERLEQVVQWTTGSCNPQGSSLAMTDIIAPAQTLTRPLAEACRPCIARLRGRPDALTRAAEDEGGCSPGRRAGGRDSRISGGERWRTSGGPGSGTSEADRLVDLGRAADQRLSRPPLRNVAAGRSGGHGGAVASGLPNGLDVSQIAGCRSAWWPCSLRGPTQC